METRGTKSPGILWIGQIAANGRSQTRDGPFGWTGRYRHGNECCSAAAPDQFARMENETFHRRVFRDGVQPDASTPAITMFEMTTACISAPRFCQRCVLRQYCHLRYKYSTLRWIIILNSPIVCNYGLMGVTNAANTTELAAIGNNGLSKKILFQNTNQIPAKIENFFQITPPQVSLWLSWCALTVVKWRNS